MKQLSSFRGWYLKTPVVWSVTQDQLKLPLALIDEIDTKARQMNVSITDWALEEYIKVL